MRKSILPFLLVFGIALASFAQTPKPPYKSSKFEQLGQELPTPNNYRTGSGAPGHEYWQQQADYKIKVKLDDNTQMITGSETITYTNNSPDELTYLWVQLDQNRYHKDADSYKANNISINSERPSWSLMRWISGKNSPNGYQISNVKGTDGKELTYLINKTMMRIELPTPIQAKGGIFTFSLDWKHKIRNCSKVGGRGGFEYFPEDDNYIYEMAQWYPRMAVYDDVNGWQNKQFLGRGEFALTFGDFEVEITAPEDHIVASTGELQNPDKVLSKTHLNRLKKAKKAKKPLMIVNQQEATENENEKATKSKTWVYHAKNVRDFAWASSRKFIWDAMQVDVEGKKVWAMSYYPKEANPLWEDYSTNSVALTLEVYSKHTIAYPYPVAISVNGPVGGMEYPMLSFNNLGRPDKQGKYPEAVRNRTIGVIIHEVGHNFFPMIINSDERQWTWMDEGLNTFCQYLTEVEVPKTDWGKGAYPERFPSRRGPAKNIVPYMRADQSEIVPIMTNSEQIHQFGNNAYGKPATALNILRETVMGRELFDYAFKEYARRWAFKHPKPADFFRTMEDASAVDLDWFWRGWFYTTEPCDIALEDVKLYRFMETKVNNVKASEPFATNRLDATVLARFKDSMNEGEKAMTSKDKYYYSAKFRNKGGLLMPIIVQINFKDGTSQVERLPAEIWRQDPEKCQHVFVTDKEAKSIIVDPFQETADIDESNNAMPKGEKPNRFKRFKENDR